MIMTTALNYQSAPGHEASAVWARGPRVMARTNSLFPPRCIKCNTPNNLKWNIRNLTWAPPYLYFVLLLGLIPAIIILLILQRKAVIQVATCVPCRRKILVQRLIAWGIFLLGLLSIPLAIIADKPVLLLLFPLLLIASIVYAIIACRVYTVARIENNIVTLKGLHPDFVASLDQQ